MIKTGPIVTSRPLVRAIEWQTLALIVGCYALWLGAGLLYANLPIGSILLLAIAIVLHSSLQHEAIHRHPTRSPRWNAALLALPLGLIIPYLRYRKLHLLHHRDERLTDPYDDPESFYRAQSDFRRLPRIGQAVLAWNNILLVRMLIGPAITAAMFLRTEIEAMRRPAERAELVLAWVLHAIGLAGIGLVVHFVFAMPYGLYLLGAYGGLSLLAIRAFCEHRWAERPQHRTVIVEHSWLGLLFLNNNFHLVHHTHPGMPWYDLPLAYRARRDDWRAINGGYVFHGYRAVFRRFALRAKEPVPHPVR